jgi:hypothetical protein
MVDASHVVVTEAVLMHSSRSSGEETKQVVISSSQVLEASAEAIERSIVAIRADASIR